MKKGILVLFFLFLVSSLCRAETFTSYREATGTICYTNENVSAAKPITTYKDSDGTLVYTNKCVTLQGKKSSKKTSKPQVNLSKPVLPARPVKAVTASPSMVFNQKLTSMLKKWQHIVIPMILVLGISEILFVLVAKFIATQRQWSRRNAVLIAQIIWLFFAYQIVIHGFAQLSALTYR